MHLPEGITSRLHHLEYEYFNNKELDELYVASGFHFFASAIVNVFIPIYLLELGYSLGDVALFYMSLFSTWSLTYILGVWLSTRWGMKKTIALGIFFSFLFYISLLWLQDGGSIFLSAILMAIGATFYFSGRSLDFTRFGSGGKEGAQFSMFKAIAITAGVFGPLLGGWLVSAYSYETMLWVVAAIVFLAPLPLFLTPDQKADGDLRVKEVLKADTPEAGLTYTLAGVMGGIMGIFWPILIYFVVKDPISLGGVISITSLFMVGIVLISGKMADTKPRGAFTWGGINQIISIIARMFFLSPAGVFFMNVYAQASASFMDTTFIKIAYAEARKNKDQPAYFVFRETGMTLGRVFGIVLFWITQSFAFVFSVAAVIGVLFIGLVRRVQLPKGQK